MNILNDFQFLRPVFLWLLPLLFVVPFILKRSASASSVWEKVCDRVLLSYLMVGNNKKTRQKFNFWIYPALLCAVIALAGPSFRQTVQPAILKEMPLMIVLDLSSDMNRSEAGVSRLTRAKIEISDVLKKSQAAPSGLIVYTYEPFLVSPLAYDPNIIVNLMPAVNTDIMPVGGNKADRAIELAASKFVSNGYKEGNILILTADIPLDFDKSLQEAYKAAEKGYKVSVYGLTSKVNEKLEQLAKAGGGIYLNTGYASSDSLIRLLKNPYSDDYSENKNVISVAEDDGIYFVFACLFCVLMIFWGQIGVFAVLFLLPVSADAGFLFNDNQEGALFFSSKEYNKAAAKFKDEDWKAAAYYKAQNYDSAIKILENKNDVTSLYNKGNALAKSGKIKEAMDAYEKVLKEEPNHEDAKFNLEYLKRLAQEQQSNAENQNSEQQEQQKNEQKNDSNENENQNDNQNNRQQDQEKSKEENQNQSEAQNENQSAADKQKDDEQDEQSDEQKDSDSKLQNDMSQEQKEAPVLPAKEQEVPEYDETVQAREQKFRAVQEDPGGLLKAFIKEEYLKKRYDH